MYQVNNQKLTEIAHRYDLDLVVYIEELALSGKLAESDTIRGKG
jgi:hypothetical protein